MVGADSLPLRAPRRTSIPIRHGTALSNVPAPHVSFRCMTRATFIVQIESPIARLVKNEQRGLEEHSGALVSELIILNVNLSSYLRICVIGAL